MGDFHSVQLMPSTQEPDSSPLTDSDIQQRLSNPSNTMNGQSLAFDSEGNVVAATTSANQAIMLGGGSPSSLYAVERQRIKTRLDELSEAYQALDPADPRRNALRKEAAKLEAAAQELAKKEEREIAHGNAERVRESNATVSRLTADLAATEALAADREKRRRKRR